MLRKIVKSIPNTITLLNLLSGTIAIYFAFNASQTIAGLQGWLWATIMIGAAALFDFCDGFAARLLNAKSLIGKELDSLCDLVSFGVAPAMLLMNVLAEAGARVWAFSAMLIPLMGALRLAIFNVDDEQTVTFKGLPIPANAIFWIGAVAAIYQFGIQPTIAVSVATVAAISLLMVSKVKMFSLKMANLNPLQNIKQYLLIIGAILFVIFWGLSGLAATILLYILLSLIEIKITVERKD